MSEMSGATRHFTRHLKPAPLCGKSFFVGNVGWDIYKSAFSNYFPVNVNQHSQMNFSGYVFLPPDKPDKKEKSAPLWDFWLIKNVG